MAESVTGFKGTRKEVSTVDQAWRKGWFALGDSDPDSKDIKLLLLPRDDARQDVSIEEVATSLSASPIIDGAALHILTDDDGETVVFYTAPTRPGRVAAMALRLLVDELTDIRQPRTT